MKGNKVTRPIIEIFNFREENERLRADRQIDLANKKIYRERAGGGGGISQMRKHDSVQ